MELITDLIDVFRRHYNAERAVLMKQYMRNLFPFVGLPSPVRRDLQKQFITNARLHADPIGLAEQLWSVDEREFQYTACDLLVGIAKSAQYRSKLGSVSRNLHRIEKLITTKSWWDTVDSLAPHLSYAMLVDPEKMNGHQSDDGTPKHGTKAEEYALKWIESDNIWLQRSAIILQLTAKRKTDFQLLSRLILRRAHSKEFFVQKAAGWALREYSKVEPDKVRIFIKQNHDRLSRVTLREGEKYC